MRIIIAHTADPYNPTMGGAVRYSLNLLRYLSKKGVDTTFLGVQDGTKKPSMYTGSDFTFVPIVENRGAGADIFYWYFANLLLKAPFLRIPRTALIHTHRLEYMLVFVLFYPQNPKVFLQGSPPLHYARLNHTRIFPVIEKLYRVAESFCLKRIDYLITTEEIKKCYVEKYPWVASKIRVMPVSGVDLDEFKPMDRKRVRQKYGFRPKDKIIIFMGRLEKVKNLDLLLRSFTLVKRQLSEAKLLVVGDGPELSRLKEMSIALRLRDVIFAGKVDKVPEILNCADVLALSTLKEGCEGSPTVIREALACGVPVVSTDVGDSRKIVNKDLLGRITSWDEESFAQALINVLNTNPEKIKQECRRVSKAFGFDALAEKVINVYRDAISIRNRDA